MVVQYCDILKVLKDVGYDEKHPELDALYLSCEKDNVLAAQLIYGFIKPFVQKIDMLYYLRKSCIYGALSVAQWIYSYVLIVMLRIYLTLLIMGLI